MKFAIVFKIVFKFFFVLFEFIDRYTVTDQPSFSSLAEWLLDIIPETKKVLNIFTAESESFSFQFCNILQIFKKSVSFKFTNKAGKLKVPESNQVEISLT